MRPFSRRHYRDTVTVTPPARGGLGKPVAALARVGVACDVQENTGITAAEARTTGGLRVGSTQEFIVDFPADPHIAGGSYAVTWTTNGRSVELGTTIGQAIPEPADAAGNPVNWRVRVSQQD